MYINQKIEELNTSVKEEEKYLKAVFRDKWKKISDESKKSLISEEVIWKSISKKIDCEFSSVCICLTSALESELNKYFFENYKKYLQNTYVEPDFDSWPCSMLSINKKEMNKYNSGVCEKPHVKSKKRFMLGDLPYILCVKFGNISNEKKKEEKNILNKYIESILKDKYKKDYKTIFVDKYLNNEVSFVEKCENVRIKYRNKAAHKENVNKSEAQNCYNEIIGNIEDENLFSGILLQLLEVLE